MELSARADPECNNTTCLPYAELATLGQKKERSHFISPCSPCPSPLPLHSTTTVPEAVSHLLASDQQHAVLLAMLQLSVDVVKHQQLTPAVLQQLHLVTHLKQSGTSPADTHRAAVHSTHPVPGRHPTGGAVPWGEHGLLELHPRKGDPGLEKRRWAGGFAELASEQLNMFQWHLQALISTGLPPAGTTSSNRTQILTK